MSLLRIAAVALVGALSVSAASIVFNFDSDAAGKATPFTDTVSGLSATFSTSADPGGFVVESTFFKTLTGNVLLDPGPSGANAIPLTILFSSPLSSLSLLFATNSAAGVPFQLQAFNGSAVIGTVSASGTIPAGFSFPEGSISFSGGAFNRVVLSSTAVDFAIDDVSASTVPEPSSVLFVAVGFAVLGGLARRRRSSDSSAWPRA